MMNWHKSLTMDDEVQVQVHYYYAQMATSIVHMEKWPCLENAPMTRATAQLGCLNLYNHQRKLVGLPSNVYICLIFSHFMYICCAKVDGFFVCRMEVLHRSIELAVAILALCSRPIIVLTHGLEQSHY